MGIKLNFIIFFAFAYTLCANPLSTDAAKNALEFTSEFIQQKSSSLAMQTRQKDPFGKPKDPHKKEKKKAPKNNAQRKTNQEERVLIEKEIVKLSKNINIFRSSVMINSIPYKKRDTIKVRVKHKGNEQTFKLKIISIRRNSIKFMNLTDEEKGVFTLNINNSRIIQKADKMPQLNENNKVIDIP